MKTPQKAFYEGLKKQAQNRLGEAIDEILPEGFGAFCAEFGFDPDGFGLQGDISSPYEHRVVMVA